MRVQVAEVAGFFGFHLGKRLPSAGYLGYDIDDLNGVRARAAASPGSPNATRRGYACRGYWPDGRAAGPPCTIRVLLDRPSRKPAVPLLAEASRLVAAKAPQS